MAFKIIWFFFREKTEFIPARLNNQYKAWNYKKRRTKRLNRVYTGHEKPEKQVNFVKSHGKNNENFKKLTKAMKVVMKKNLPVLLFFNLFSVNCISFYYHRFYCFYDLHENSSTKKYVKKCRYVLQWQIWKWIIH